MRTGEKIIESQTKIRFPDCDPFNHLNNSRYIDYMINAREDQVLEHYGFDIYRMALEKGLSWVVTQNQIAYFAPAVLMETVTIQTQLIFCDSKTLTVEAKMWNDDKTQLKAVFWCTFMHYDLIHKKSVPHAEELMAFFKGIEARIEDARFEDRIKNLRAR